MATFLESEIKEVQKMVVMVTYFMSMIVDNTSSIIINKILACPCIEVPHYHEAYMYIQL